MRNVVIGLSIVFLVVLGGGIAFYYYASHSGGNMDASGKAYVDQAVPAIVSTWSKDELVKRATPQLQEKIGDKVDDLFSRLHTGLGSFQSYDGATGKTYSHFSLREMRMTARAAYDASVTFRNGKMDMTLIIVWDGSDWQIAGFEIKPKRS